MAGPVPAALDGPPPSPVNPSIPGQGPQMMPPSAPGQGPPPPSGGPGGPDSASSGIQALIRIGVEIDRGLAVLSDAAPTAAADFRAAKQSLQAGLAKLVSGSSGLTGPGGGAPSLSPTAVGDQFPGSMSPSKF